MARAQWTIASGAIAKLFDTIEHLGLDAAAICAEAAFDRSICANADARVPLLMLRALWGVVCRHAGRTDLALLNAERFSPSDYGLVGFVASTCATLGEALAHVVRYMRLWSDEPVVRFRGADTLIFTHRARHTDSVGLRCASESALAELLHAARVATAAPIAPARVCFAHPAPKDMATYARFFGVSVRFAARETLMRFDERALFMPLRRADAKLGAFLRRAANEALGGLGDTPISAPSAGGVPRPVSVPRATSQLLRQELAESLRRGVPAFDDIAKKVALSGRTLRRRLRDEGTSFRALLDQTRAELARRYVADRRLPLAEVAFLLGFSEPSAFHRAFKRWTDETPSAYRAMQPRISAGPGQ